MMNEKHKQQTVNNAANALGDVGTSLLNRIRPLLDLVYEAGYNQAKKDADQFQPVEQYWNPRTVKNLDMNKGCPVCGIGADGKSYGYVCQRNDCPTKVTC